MTLTTPETQPAPPSQRTGAGTLTAIDLFRGLTILEVVTHHTTGMAFRYTTPGTLEHEVLSVLNRTLHFAVPAFMFLSATLLTASLLKRFDARTYFTRRVVRGGWPYLLWSVLYALWYVWTEQRPPEVLTDPAKWTFYLLYGKASYHLYFLLVALEAYFILPLLLPLARRKPGIPLVFLVGVVVQLGLFLLNRHVLKFQFPASTILWYMLPVLLGVGVGANLRTFPDWWRRHWWLLVGLMLLAYAAYLPTSLANLRGEKVDALLSPQDDEPISRSAWLGRPVGAPKAKHVLALLDRLAFVRTFPVQGNLRAFLPQSRLDHLAGEARRLSASHLGDFEPGRRRATERAGVAPVEAHAPHAAA